MLLFSTTEVSIFFWPLLCTSCGYLTPFFPLRSPRVRLFDRPPAEAGAALLGTACVWRAASPAVPPSIAGGSSSELEMRAAIVAHMPAVEVFGVTCASGKTAADYPFTMAFYASAPYAHFKKQHFDDLLPKTMADTVPSDGAPQRVFLLWNARSMCSC